MMKKDKLFMISYLTLFGIIVIFALSIINMKQGIYIDGVDISRQSVYDGDLTDFIMIAQRYADNHIYNDTFKCTNYTDGLAAIAEELGLKVKKAIQCSDNKTDCHAFLKLTVDFEPQTARFTDYSQKYPNNYKYP